MKIIAHIALAATLSFALFGCNESGKRAKLVDKFSDDFETFKKEVLECDKVAPVLNLGGADFDHFHRELVQPYLNELNELKKQAETQPRTDPSLKKKANSIFNKMQEYNLNEEEGEKYANTCVRLDMMLELYKNLLNQQEYDIYKERFNPQIKDIYDYDGSKEYKELERKLLERRFKG